MAEQRSKMMMQMLSLDGPVVSDIQVHASMGVMWVEGFLAGSRFQQRGGRQ
jgi:hypothetical protein